LQRRLSWIGGPVIAVGTIPIRHTTTKRRLDGNLIDNDIEYQLKPPVTGGLR